MLSDFELTMLIIGIVIYFTVVIIVAVYYGVKSYRDGKGIWYHPVYRARAMTIFFVFGIILFAIIGIISICLG